MMIISQKHTKTHSLTHSLRPPLPNLNNSCCCWSILYTLLSASQKQTCCCRHCCSSFYMRILSEHWKDASPAIGSAFSVHTCGSETEWNVLIVKLIKAVSLTTGYAMCLLQRVPSSVMDKRWKIYCSTHTCLCIYKERKR